MLERCLEGLLTQTDYPDIEILIVDNGSVEGATLRLLQRAQHDPRVRVLPQPGPFNWSALNNRGVREAKGALLLLLNNDVEVVTPDWLAAMAGHAMRPDVGVVGARLVFPDGGLQHGGVLLGPRGQGGARDDPCRGGRRRLPGASRPPTRLVGCHRGMPGHPPGRVRPVWAAWMQTTSVSLGATSTSACGCGRAGYRVLWLPDVVLTHREMATRGRDVTLAQQARHETERAALRPALA